MSEIHPDAVSLEDATIDGPPISQTPAEPDDAAEPEGVVEHAGKRMVDVSVLAAERRRVREATERTFREKELGPLQAKAAEADQLRAALNELRPIVEQVRRNPDLLKPPKPTTAEEQVTDDEAAAEARDLELYNAQTGQPDIGRAKRIIARRRQEAQSAAQQAAQAAIGPITSQGAQSASRQNFVSMATRRDAHDQPLVDPKALAEIWASLPAELTQHAEVGELLLDAAIGKTVRGGARVPRADRAPIVSEPAGGRNGPSYQMDRMAKQIANHAGMSEKAFTDAAKTFRPDTVNIIGD